MTNNYRNIYTKLFPNYRSVKMSAATLLAPESVPVLSQYEAWNILLCSLLWNIFTRQDILQSPGGQQLINYTRSREMLMDCQLYASSISTFLHSSKFTSNLSSKPFFSTDLEWDITSNLFYQFCFWIITYVLKTITN